MENKVLTEFGKYAISNLSYLHKWPYFKIIISNIITHLSLKSPNPTVEIVVVAKYQDSKKSRFSSVEIIAAGMSVVSEYTIISRPNTEICLIEIKTHE